MKSLINYFKDHIQEYIEDNIGSWESSDEAIAYMMDSHKRLTELKKIPEIVRNKKGNLSSNKLMYLVYDKIEAQSLLEKVKFHLKNPKRGEGKREGKILLSSEMKSIMKQTLDLELKYKDYFTINPKYFIKKDDKQS